jgi:hypothetical protein
MEKISALEAKLDRIINLLAPAIVIDSEQLEPETKAEANEETVTEPEVKAPAKRKKKVSA